MTDILYVQGVEVQATIGIEKWEQAIKQKIRFDLEMLTDAKLAAATDQIADSINYAVVTTKLIDYIEQSKFQLLETLAENCAQIVMTEFNVQGLRLRMSKPGIVRHSKDSGVIIARGSWQNHQGL